MRIFRSRRKPRRFDYEPRFYNPKEDDEAKRRQRMRRRMKVQSKARRSRRDKSTLFYLLALLAFAIFIYTSLG